MNPEIKNCQNCHNDFQIGSDDFAFYERIKMPAPTFCWECRHQRRMSFRNERTLFKRKCNASGHTEDVISAYSPQSPVVVYDNKYWWSDAWNATDFGTAYDFGKPFFLQFKELLERVPLIAVSVANMSNSSYCNVSEGDKDGYLLSASFRNERTLYSNRVTFSKDSSDLYISDRNELCYDCVNCKGSYRLSFSKNCTDCMNSAFLNDCTNCQNCFGCSNLRNKQFCFMNEQCTKEEYAKKLAEYDLGSLTAIERAREAQKSTLDSSIHRFARIFKSIDSTGDNLFNVKNCKMCFDLMGDPSAEDMKYCAWAGFGCKDVWDGGPGIGGGGDLIYESYDCGIQSNRLSFCGVVYSSYDVFYSINCHGSHHLFGCYGLRSKEYCILNKQYTKEEYEALLPKIIEQMNAMPYVDKKSRTYKFGEFFPIETSPFTYNESISFDYFPMTKDDAIESGFPWRDRDTRSYQISKQSNELPDNIKDVPDSILNEIISCAHEGKCTHQCSTAFRVVPEELKLLRHLGITLPRSCFNCRHHERLAKRNPMKLWHRKCQCAGGTSENGIYKNTVAHTHHGAGHCPNEFETSYSPDRKEIVYCEQCYQAEVI